MSIKELQNWKKYKAWVAEQNKPIYEAWLKLDRELSENWKKHEAEAERRNERRRKVYDKKLQAREEWEALPFHKKLFKLPPPEVEIWDYPVRHHPPMYMGLSWPMGLKQVTYEGYLDWLESRLLIEAKQGKSNKDVRHLRKSNR